VRSAAADVEDVAGGLRHFQGQAERPCDVVHADEIALLVTVLEDPDGFCLQEL